jgi:SAM-dependent methyltransferase
MARDLAAELAKPSFTPAQREAPALVELVIAGNERAAAALVKIAAREAVVARLGVEDDAARARLVGVLGQLARAGDEAAQKLLVARAGDPAPRVRRAAESALGKLGGDVARDALLQRWDAGDVTPDERRVLVEALGKVGGDVALQRLRALAPGEDAELARRRERALLMLERDARREQASAIAVDVPPPQPLTVRLGCRAGLAVLLAEELRALGFAPELRGDAAAEVRLAAPWQALFASRLWVRAAIALPPGSSIVPSLGRSAGGPRDALVTAALLAQLPLLRAWTRGPIRWRLAFAHGHQRARVWQIARDVTAAAPELVNDPTETTWELLVGDALELVPRRAPDPRFSYRVADLPAASHPTVAAALALLAGVRAGERVWDPFCGSGLELVECSRGAAVTLVGSDVDPAALAAARANLDAAGVRAELVQADARTHAVTAVDAIVTNPPLGSRVQLDAPALLAAALPQLARQLAPGGRLVWITPAPRRTGPVAQAAGLRLARALRVDLGGVRGQVERWERG